MAILATTPVPTANGWKLAHELTTDDIIFNHEGHPQPIGTIQTWMPTACYEVHFDDGLAVTGDRYLAFQCQTKDWRDHLSRHTNRKNRKKNQPFRYKLKRKTAAELYKGPLLHADKRREYSLGTAGPVQFGSVDLPVPPYVLGLWLGSKSQKGYHWVSDTMNVKGMRAKLRNKGFAIVTKPYGNSRVMEFRPSIPHAFASMNATVPHEIPFYYLFGSVDQRKELLEGLIDSEDAKKWESVNKYGITDASWISVRRKQALIESLGIKTKLESHKKGSSYSLLFNYNPNNPMHTRRFITKVDKLPPKQCVHIATEDPFLVAEGFLAVC